MKKRKDDFIKYSTVEELDKYVNKNSKYALLILVVLMVIGLLLGFFKPFSDEVNLIASIFLILGIMYGILVFFGFLNIIPIPKKYEKEGN